MNKHSKTIEFQRIVRDQIEYRFAPLIKEQTRINPARAKRLMQAESALFQGHSCAFIRA